MRGRRARYLSGVSSARSVLLVLAGLTLALIGFARPAHALPNWLTFKPNPWGEYFDERPSIPTVDHAWSTYLKFNHFYCDHFAIPIGDQVREYDEAVINGHPDVADQIYQKISHTLFVELGERHYCFRAAAFSYAINSLYWIDTTPTPNEPSGRWVHDINLQKAFLLAGLINQGKVAILTPGEREREQGLMAKRTDRGTPEVLGTFNCETSTISFDILQRPLDEATTLIHELDHLLRDKILSDEYKGWMQRDTAAPRAEMKRLSWRDILLLDEALATTYGAILQLRYRLSPLFREPINDLSFSMGDGPIDHMWKAVNACSRWGKGPYSIDTTVVEEVLSGFLDSERPNSCLNPGFYEYMRGHPYVPGDRFSLGALEGARLKYAIPSTTPASAAEIYQLILKAYFAGNTPFELRKDLDPAYLNIGWAILSRWDRNLDVLQAFVDFNLVDTPAPMMQQLDEILRLTSTETSVCRDYVKAFRAGALDGYLNVYDAVRDEKGVKGSLLVKTEKGVKGSETVQLEKGVKGETSALRFCVDFQKKL